MNQSRPLTLSLFSCGDGMRLAAWSVFPPMLLLYVYLCILPFVFSIEIKSLNTRFFNYRSGCATGGISLMLITVFFSLNSGVAFITIVLVI